MRGLRQVKTAAGRFSDGRHAFGGVLAFVILGLSCSSVYGESNPEPSPDGSLSEPALFLGDCQLKSDPGSESSFSDIGFKLCIKARTGAEVTFVGGNPEENLWIKYTRGYGGLHVNNWLSLHVQGMARDAEPLGSKLTEKKDRHRDFAVVRIGNPVVNHVRLTAGRMRLPFGIDSAVATESYNVRENRAFWSSPDYAADLTFDTQSALQFDLSYGRSKLVNGRETSTSAPATESTAASSPIENEKLLDEAVSARLMYDMPALDGSRFVLSGYGDGNGVRKAGFGFVVVSSKGDQTHAEYVRRMETPIGLGASHEQLIRIGYLSTWRNSSRWAVQFDDERRRFRMGTIGQDLYLYKHVLMRVAISYSKAEAGHDGQRWSLTTGLEAGL